MRILIAGAGIAGLTLAALLQKQGHEVALIDKASEPSRRTDHPIALWPHGAKVLNALGLYDEFLAKSVSVNTTVLFGRKNKIVNLYDLNALTFGFAPPRVVQKSQLLSLIEQALYDVEISRPLSIKAARTLKDKVAIVLSDDSETEADLLLFADGRDSSGHSLIGGPQRERVTGWSALAGGGKQLENRNEIIEHWRAGFALTIYPGDTGASSLWSVPSSVLAQPANEGVTEAKNKALREYLLASCNLSEKLIEDFTPNLGACYALTDTRRQKWVEGRLALVGDAAISYLPGSEVGASMALESAAVLAEELARAPSTFVPLALELYARRRRPRAEFVQNQARAIMEFKLTQSQRYARIRDTLVRFHDMRQLTGPKVKLLRTPI